MTIVSFFSSRRRILILAAATLLLHIMAIDWLGAHIGVADVPAKNDSTVISAMLHPAPDEALAASSVPAEAAPAPQATPPAAPAPAAQRPTSPSSEAAAGDTAGPDGGAAASTASATEPASTPEAPPPASEAAGAPPAVAEVPVAPPAAPEGAAPAPLGTRRYKVRLPPSAKFELDMKRKDADGTDWSGSGSMSWQTNGANYQVGLDITVTLFHVNVLSLASEGMIDDAGIAPLKMTEKRRSRSATNTHFNYEDKRITFSANENSYPLLAGTQDKATLPFQLSAIGRADSGQFSEDVDILVGDDKSATIYRFQLVGEETLDTAMGQQTTWHLARPPRPGSYNARLDVWLAPGLDWFPIQIRNTEGNGAVTTQTVTKISYANAKSAK
jgi:hypothetical protein